MKNILFAIIVLSGFYSCEIEKLTPEDVVLNDPTWNDPTAETDPNSIIVPCTLVSNVVRFNNQNYGVTASEVNSPFAQEGLFGANYSVSADVTLGYDVEFYFNGAPTSGYYTTYNGSNVGASQVMMRTFVSGSFYYNDPGATLYVQKYTDSLVLTYCNVSFTNGITINNNRGKVVVEL